VAGARSKAEAIAAAMGVQLGTVFEVMEGGVEPMNPQMRFGVAMVKTDAATPVEPGQVRVHASVTVRYVIAVTRQNERPGLARRAGAVRISLRF